VLTEGGVAFPRASGGIAGAVELDAAADDVVVRIAGADGQVLRTLDLGRQKAGTVAYDWDGKTDGGEDAGPGPYSVTATAQAGGKPAPARGLVWAPVQSVSTASGQPVLDVVGLGTIPVTAVRSVG
jgi:flagellar basal-body rod modification protein FlgD